MNWVRAIAGVLVLWSGTAWGATLTWNANNEPDLAGYRVYQCNRLPCTPASANDSLFVTLGTATSFNIGTPAVTQYYFITAYDLAGNESGSSNLATFTSAEDPVAVEILRETRHGSNLETFTSAGVPPPPPPPEAPPTTPNGLHITAVQ